MACFLVNNLLHPTRLAISRMLLFFHFFIGCREKRLQKLVKS